MSGARGRQLFGVVNCRIYDAPDADGGVADGGVTRAAMGGSCFVDGREIKQVWYADTEAGIVKTYDVLGDGKAHPGREFAPADFPGREVDAPLDGVLSETLRGKVELFAGVESRTEVIP
jgi:hypothetical protein